MTIVKRISNKCISILYPLFETLGYHVVPVHHGSPIPKTSDLTDVLFNTRSECIGLNWNLEVQDHYRDSIFPNYAKEMEFEPNPGLSVVDSLIFYAMIRQHKPKKIVEIGSGWSTEIASHACVKNREEGHQCQLITIDPQPSQRVKNGFNGLTSLISKKVEEVALEEITDCDLLFIDSSHVVKIGGDVNYEILEIVPRLKPGALVHWHDILLPGEYWKDWVKYDRYIWTEQYLLHAFMKFNQEFEIQWASRYMQLNFPQSLQKAIPIFQPDKQRITSFWVRRKA